MVGRAILAGVSIVTIVGTSVAGAVPTATATAPRTALHLDGPSRAAVGHVVSVQLLADAPRAIGAFQANLRYDHRALEVVRVRSPKTLPGSGRLTALSAVETPDRTVLAGWTCGGQVCGAASAVARHHVLLATIDIEMVRAGAVELRIDGAVIVDRAGAAIGNASARTVLGSANNGRSYRAPGRSTFSIASRAARGAHARVDINGDGRVTPLDVSALTAVWVHGAELGANCPAPDPGTDVNGDGCMTIADLQTVAGAITSTPVRPSALIVRAAAITTFTVNSTGDGADATANGLCQTATVGECTLRAALQEANRASVPISIAFNIPGAGIRTIAPGTRLPAMNNPNGITIDGFTQPGSSPNTDPLADNAVYGIELKGTGGTGIDGLFVTQANNVIRGLNMHGFNRAIWVYGTSATNNLVEGNMLGLTPSGDFDPTYALVNSATCIVVQQGAAHNQIGAPGDANRNVVSGCDHQDIATYDWPTQYTTIQNNITGLDPTGTLRRGAKSHGIDINTGTQHTVIGGLGVGERNVSSGNGQEGVEISHNPLTLYNSVVGNFLGTDLTGNNAPSYAVNGQWSMHLEGFPNCNNAVCPLDAGFNTVTDNVIVNAARGGFLVDKGVHDSLIARNKIGVTADGSPAGNKLFGMNIQAGSVRITVGPGNEIAYNDNGLQMESDGVEPPNSASSLTNQNTITQNSIHDNGVGGIVALGIDLAPFGTVNTVANSASNVNDAMIAPTLSNPTPVTIDATTCAGCVVEVFLANQPAGAFGSGVTYLATATADGAGHATVALPDVAKSHTVTATATNTAGSTSEFSRNVLIPGSTAGNVAPVAQFTPTCNGLACTFDASASTDSDGTIVSYSWNFGDGTPVATGATVQHTFATTNSYSVTLTVTDNGGAATPLTTAVAVVDLPPTAAFTGSCSFLACTFDGSSSSDPDNGISTYTWSFGDTTSGVDMTPTHTYAVANSYTVTLTVDDGAGATSTVSQVFATTVPSSSLVASDSFGRTVASGWGSADIGGAYALATAAATGSVAVNGGAGVVQLTVTPSGRGFYLSGVSVLDSDSTIDVSTNVAPTGGTWGQAAYLTARRVSANTEYRARLRFVPGGGVRLMFVKTVGNTTEVAIGPEALVTGLAYVAGQAYTVRFDVTGTNPTTLQAKVWVAGTTEPAAWKVTQTDGEAALQAAGNPGVRGFLGAGATNQPAWSFDNLAVTNLNAANLPPTAAFTGNCTFLACSFDGSSSSDPDNGIASYAWDFADTTSGSAMLVDHTYAVPNSYMVTLTVDDGKGGSASVSHSFVVTAPGPTVVASDTFGRSVASGWGTANVGGAYAAAAGGGMAAVNGSAGSFKFTSAGSGGGVYLPSATALNTDVLVDVSTSAAPTGGTWGQVAYLTARRVAANTEYRVRLRFVPGGGVKLSFVKTVASTTEVVIGSEAAVVGVPYVAGQAYSLRFDVTGTNPATLRARVWVAGTAEPAAWNVTQTDSEASLQAAGSPGVRAFLGANATNQPIWLYDNLVVTDLG